MTQTAHRPLAGDIAVTGTPPQRWLGTALLVLGLGAAVIALLGPLATGVIRYHASPGALNQLAGGDAAALLLVAPTSIVAGVLVLRGHRAGPVLALGPAIYAVYTYVQLGLSVDVTRYPGNSERFFPLFIGLFVLAAAIAIRAWTTIDTTDLPPTSRRLDRALGTFLLLVAAFLTFGLHLPGLADAMRAQPAGPEYLADPFLFWLVKFMDLGIVVPALVVIGVGILRGVGWARQAVYAAVGWFALLGTAVAGMAIVMQSTGDPAASVANTVAFTGFALFALAVAAIVFQPLLARPGAP